MDAVATAGNVNDHEPYVDCIRRVKKRTEVDEAVADGGYDVISVHKLLADLEVTTYIPAVERRSGSADGSRFTIRDFLYDQDSDSFRCPGGKILDYRSVRDFNKVYGARQPDCQGCPLASQYLAPTKKYRRLERPIYQEYLEQAHVRCETPRYFALQKKRRGWSEGTFAIMKARHGLRRAMRRGLVKMQEQLRMAAVAMNICRMVRATP